MDYDKDAHIEKLETINSALVDKLENLKRRKMARNDEAALKWRGKAFYWKRKFEALAQIKEISGITKQTGGESL